MFTKAKLSRRYAQSPWMPCPIRSEWESCQQLCRPSQMETTPGLTQLSPDVWKEEEQRDCSRREGREIGKRNGIAWILLSLKKKPNRCVSPKGDTSGLSLSLTHTHTHTFHQLRKVRKWENALGFLRSVLLPSSILTGVLWSSFLNSHSLIKQSCNDMQMTHRETL